MKTAHYSIWINSGTNGWNHNLLPLTLPLFYF
uniref:Uncharacterized protein n=1 Tax=Rhizophora mucronata TaxID=61149 RepID=A0A2P2NQF9_RHIMU